jgi:ubiquinone/menaquinone biosynthesis C-methylase UbiE
MNRLENWFCATQFWRNLTQRKWLPALLEGIDLGDRALEVGAGPGAATAELSRRADCVVSLEYSHKFCVDLRSRIGAGAVVQGDASALPFASGAFSSVVAILMLHHLQSVDAQDKTFAEIQRVLMPGGVFAALDIHDSFLSRILHFRSIFVPVSAGGLGARLRSAGFSNVKMRVLSAGFAVQARKS